MIGVRAAAIAALVIVAALAVPSPTLTATDLTAGRVVLCRPVAGPGFTLAFTHSMYGGEVAEAYTAAGGRLRRVAMTTANAAAAEYYAYYGRVSRVGNRYRVDSPPVAFDGLVVRVDRIGDHRLRLGRETVDLVAAAGDGHRVRLDVGAGSLASRLLGGSC